MFGSSRCTVMRWSIKDDCDQSFSNNVRTGMSHPFKVEEVFFQGLSSLCLLALVDDVRILFIATAFIILAAMRFPVSQTHPTEICPDKQTCTSIRVGRETFVWIRTEFIFIKSSCMEGSDALTVFTLGTLLLRKKKKVSKHILCGSLKFKDWTSCKWQFYIEILIILRYIYIICE